MIATTGNVYLNSAASVDSYDSSVGGYGGTNRGANATVRAAQMVVRNGGSLQGVEVNGSPSSLAALAIPANATRLPLGSSSPGNLNINGPSDSITLAPGNYVASNINVNYPGAISVSAGGTVAIWVTGSLNLGGTENANGSPSKLVFLVAGSGSVNLNSNGQLVGMIYAPNASVNINSTVFGSIVGSTVSLNSGSAVHADVSAPCPAPAAAPTSPTAAPLTSPLLPELPTKAGCFIYTKNGWIEVDCGDPQKVVRYFGVPVAGWQGEQTIPYMSGGSRKAAIPLVLGEVDTHIVGVGSEVDSLMTRSAWSVQNNTNGFPCKNANGQTCWVQFVVQSYPYFGSSSVCIWFFSDVKNRNVYDTKCLHSSSFPHASPTPVGSPGGSIPPGPLSTWFGVETRSSGLRAGDSASILGYTFLDTSTSPATPMVGMVAQYSWVPDGTGKLFDRDAINQIPGLYAVVDIDKLGLAEHWTQVTGGILGIGGGSQAVFKDTEVLTRVLASSCAGDRTPAGPICPNQPTLIFSPDNTEVTSSIGSSVRTAETDNLALVYSPTVSLLNQNLMATEILSSTNNPSSGNIAGATCLADYASHVYIKDNDRDNGGIPSNAGGAPYWESPDIFVLPHNVPPQFPDLNEVAADTEVVLGQSYDVYLRVHNDFGCNSISGVKVLINGADPDVGFGNWTSVTAGAGSGNYVSDPSNTTVPAHGRAVIGPFVWNPSTTLGAGHKCLLAAIWAGTEKPPAFPLAPAYSSNQIAQRNLQVNSECNYAITNNRAFPVNMLLGVNVTPPTPAPGSTGGPVVALTFTDPAGSWRAIWQAQASALPAGKLTVGAGSGSSSGTTTVTLGTSHIALNAVILPSGQSPNVRVSISPGSDGSAPVVSLSSILSDNQQSILVENGGSCKYVAPTDGSCGPGLSLCGGVCVDESNDPGNCGACGVTCGPTQVCLSGSCQIIDIPL